jgi:predicted DNA-binding transcriptional regulator YafY
MRRADRLFEIIQRLRRGRVLTAQALADQLKVSERTVYRNIRALVARQVPIEGETGVGYTLRRGEGGPSASRSDSVAVRS